VAFRYNDRVRVNCIPSGTGDISLGTIPTGYLSFADGGFSDGDTTIACIIVPVTGEFEVVQVTYNSAGPSLTRDPTPIESSNSGATVAFAGGNNGVVFVGLSASKVLHKDMTSAELLAAGIQGVPSIGTITATGTVQGDAATVITDKCYITAGGADTGVIVRSTTDDPIGTSKLISNKTASDKILYPDSGSSFDSEVADTGITLSPNQSIRIDREGATQWYTS